MTGRLAGKVALITGTAGGQSVAQTSYADWSFVMRNELDIVFLVTKHARPHLVARGGGSVLLVGSTAGITGSLTNPRVAHTATKGGRRDDQAAGRRGSRAPHPGQLHQPRHDPHFGHRERPARPGLADAHHPARPDRCSGGGRPVRPVPGLRRGLLRHRANLVVDGGWSAVLPGAC